MDEVIADFERRHSAIKYLHDMADIFTGVRLEDDEWDYWDNNGDHDEEGARERRISSHVMLLADIADSATPPALLDGLLPFDFPDPEIRAAYRILLNHDLDLVRARAAASHPDVAGVLELVLLHARIRAEKDARVSDPTGWFGLVWRRRHELIEADRLRVLAGRLVDSSEATAEAYDQAHRAVSEAHDRLLAGLVDEAVPPEGLPTYFPTARARLVSDETVETVALEDVAIARAVVDLVEVADRRVLLAVPWIRSSDLTSRLVDACRDRVAHGVRILLVTRPVQSTAQYAKSAADEREVKKSLVAAGVEVAWHRRLHDKVFVIDDTVICGSQNLTAADISHNPNSAIGTASAGVVEHFANRIEQLAASSDRYPADLRVPMADVPVFAYDAWTGLTHRLAVRGDADYGALEGGGEAPTDCGEIATVDSTASVWAFSSGERCLDCKQPMA